MRSFTSERRNQLLAAYTQGLVSIENDLPTRSLRAESFDAIVKVEQHRWHWRPENPRVILIAESHVYTSDADLGVRVNQDTIAALIAGSQDLPPSEFVGIVYCLGYGENQLLLNRHGEFSNRSTWQFWDLFGKVLGGGKQPRTSAGSSLRDRLEWKLGILNQLKERGIWLLDASAHAIYLGGRERRRSHDCCQAFHLQWWTHYGRHVVADCGDAVVWVIGFSVLGRLPKEPRFDSQRCIYQPNARKVDKERNWDRLLADVRRFQN